MLRTSRDEPSADAPEATPGDARARDAERPIRCAACSYAITRADQRTTVDGKHVHERANPSGFLYRIGCFREAPGCVGEGGSTAFFTWFPGYAWQLTMCGGCGVHLGWAFRGEGGGFHGLVLDRLAEGER